MPFFPRRSKPKPPPARRFRPALEILEDRLAPAAPGGPTFSPADTGAFGPAIQGQPSLSGATQNTAFTAATLANTTTGAFNSNTAVVFATISGNTFDNGTGLSLPPSAVLPAFGSPTLPSVQPPGQSGQAVNAIAADISQIALRVFSPFSLVSFVPPQTPPPRAVTLFAPGGSGGASGAGNEANQPGPMAPQIFPGGGIPVRPGIPGTPATPGTLNPNQGGPTAPSDQGLPPPQGSGELFRDLQPPGGAEETRGILPPARQALAEDQPADQGGQSGTQAPEQLPPPPVHAPANKGNPVK